MSVEIRNQFDVEDHLASLSLKWNRLVGRIHGGAAIRLRATILGDDTIAQQTIKKKLALISRNLETSIRMSRALLCSFADLNALPHGGLSSLPLPTAMDSYVRHMTFLFGQHPISAGGLLLPSPLFPPFYITRPPTPQGPPTPAKNYRTTSSLWSPLLFFRWKQALGSDLDSRPPCHSRSMSERDSIRAGLSRKRGTRLRREHLRFTVARDV